MLKINHQHHTAQYNNIIQKPSTGFDRTGFHQTSEKDAQYQQCLINNKVGICAKTDAIHNYIMQQYTHQKILIFGHTHNMNKKL